MTSNIEIQNYFIADLILSEPIELKFTQPEVEENKSNLGKLVKEKLIEKIMNYDQEQILRKFRLNIESDSIVNSRSGENSERKEDNSNLIKNSDRVSAINFQNMPEMFDSLLARKIQEIEYSSLRNSKESSTIRDHVIEALKTFEIMEETKELFEE